MTDKFNEYYKNKCPFREGDCLIVDEENDLCIIEHYQEFIDKGVINV